MSFAIVSVSIIALQLFLLSYVLLFGFTEMLVRLVHSQNATSPMLVTLLGMVMLVRLVQPENAQSPMLVTLLGMVMLVRLVQTLNAS